MPKKFFFPLLAGVALAFSAFPDARAQETAPGVPPSQNQPATAAPDSTGLFPAGSGTDAAAGQGGRRGRGGRRHGRGRRQSSYATDAATQSAAADPVEVRIAFRRAKTIALLRNPGLDALVEQADRSRTDDEKRGYLREYYTQLYAQIRRVDPSPEMKAHVDLLSAASEQRYNPQRRALRDDDEEGGGRRGRR